MDWLPTDEEDDDLDWWFEMMWGLPRQAADTSGFSVKYGSRPCTPDDTIRRN
jgi:hypothetical protein